MTNSGFEGSECEAGFGLDAFPDDGDGIAWKAAIEDSKEPVADQGQIGQERSVSASGAVLSHQCIPPPMVAVFKASPMASDQLQPLFWRPILRFETTDVVACFHRALAGALFGPSTPDNHQAAGEWEIHRHAVGCEVVQGSVVDTAVAYLAFFKKGAPEVDAFFRACFSRWGWLPLTCRR